MQLTETMTLADLRRKAGKTQPQVALSMGVSRTQVSRIEARYPDVMFPVLRRYLDALEVDIRFSGAGVVLLSDDVSTDTTRVYAESIRNDPTRGPWRRGRSA